MPRIKLTVPPEVLQTAKLASQAMDYDVGGMAAFEHPDEETGLYSYIVDVSENYLQGFELFQQHPAALAQAIEADFQTRFPDLVPPSLADCEAFTTALVIEVM